MSSSFESPKTFSTVEEFFQVREALIEAEKKAGYESRAERTPLEAAAEKIVQDLKAHEELNHHGVRLDGSGTEAGHRYLHGLESLSQSKLLKIAQKAPKGSLLHCHYDAMLPPDTILADARTQEKLYIKTDAPLINPGFFAHALPHFEVFADGPAMGATTNVFSGQYVAGSWMKYSEFLKLFPGGPHRAEAWVRKIMVLQAEDAYHPHQTVNG
jgi:adenosine deaminase CECR1